MYSYCSLGVFSNFISFGCIRRPSSPPGAVRDEAALPMSWGLQLITAHYTRDPAPPDCLCKGDLSPAMLTYPLVSRVSRTVTV
jgi:hypothetical protein